MSGQAEAFGESCIENSVPGNTFQIQNQTNQPIPLLSVYLQPRTVRPELHHHPAILISTFNITRNARSMNTSQLRSSSALLKSFLPI